MPGESCATAAPPANGTTTSVATADSPSAAPRRRLAVRMGTPSSRSGVELPPALERPAQGQFVSVLKVAADGEAAGDAGRPDAQGLEKPGQVHGGGLALDGGVGAEDHLLDALGVDPHQ